MSEKNSPIVTITRLSHEGRGIAHIEGKTIFVEGGLVGDEVEINFIKRKTNYDVANIVNILKPASDRQKPDCDFFEICGGCSLQHMGSDTQIAMKQAVLLEQLEFTGHVKPQQILPPTLSSIYGYRRKARLGVRYVIKKEKLLIGFREKNGRYLADIEACSVLDQSIGKKIPDLRNFLLTLEGYLNIPQLEIAIGDSATAIIIRHLKPLTIDDQQKIRNFGAKENYHMYLQPGNAETTHLIYPENILPRLSYQLNDFGIEMLFHPTDFTQVNSEINKKLVKLAIELLKPLAHEVVLDLFCGIGNFTLPLARFCQKVIGVEGSELMVQRGYENAEHNKIKNVEFQCQNLADSNYTGNWMDSHFDGILLDPPRVGAWEIIQKIPQSSATRIVYVSCNPATLARDAGYLCKNGFNLEVVGVLDMFPHTSHVESIALFTRI